MPFNKSRSRSTAEAVGRVALSALVSALEEREQESRSKPGRTGLRAVATGAVIYTAGRAAYSGRHLILERLGNGAVDEDEDEEYDEPEAESDEDDDEDFDDEPEAESDEDELANRRRRRRRRIRPASRPPEPPESDEDEDRADADAEPAAR